MFKTPALSHAVALVALSGAAVLGFFPPAWLPAGTGATTAIALATIALYATGLIPEAVTSLLFFFAAMLLAVAPPAVVFAGFSSTAFWIILGGLIIGMGIRHTGLGAHIAALLLARLPSRYGLVIAATALTGLAFAFLMPGAMGRMVLLVPIAVAVADRLGFPAESNGRIALVLAAVFGTHVGSFAILPSNTPNVVWSGAMQSIHGIEIGYLEYLWWHFPVLGVVRSLLLVALIVRLFPDALPASRERGEPPAAMDHQQRAMGFVLFAALALWVTDFLHGVGPAWIALAAAIVCLLQPQRLVPQRPFAALDIGPLLLVAGVLGLGAVLAHSGIGEAAFVQLLPHLPFEAGADALNYALVSLGGVALAILTAMPGVPAIGVPLGETLAQATGWPLQSVLTILAASYSTYLLPYQAPPILVGAQLGQVPWGALTRFTLIFAGLSILLIFPLHYAWLAAIGLLAGG
jgi:di/tricarboxylate transporter